MNSAVNNNFFLGLATFLLVGSLSATSGHALEGIDSSRQLTHSHAVAESSLPLLAAKKFRLRLRGAEASSNLRLPGQRGHKQQTLLA